MTGHVDDVVGAAQDEVVALFVSDAPIKAAVDLAAGDALPVGADIALVVAPHRLHETGGQGALDGHHALFVRTGQLFTGVLVEQLHVEAVHRDARAAKLAGLALDAIGYRQHGCPGFGLPIVVDDGALEGVRNPLRRGFVQGLAGQEQGPQGPQVVAAEIGRILLLEHPHRRGRTEHRRDLVLLNKAPPDARIGPNGQALIHDGGHAMQKRPIDDVAVPHHPADVAGGEVRFPRVAHEDVLHRGGQVHHVAAGVPLHALRTTGGSARVKRVARMGCFHPLARHLRAHMCSRQAGVIFVATRRHRHVGQAAVDHQHLAGLALGQFNRLVQQPLIGNHLAAAAARIGTHDHLGLGVIDAAGQGHTGKSTEHHGVDRANAHTGQHGKRGLGDHRHVDQDPIALAHTLCPEHGRHLLHLFVQFSIGVGDFAVYFGGYPDEGGLVAAISQMPVDRVVAQVGGSPHVPMRERCTRIVQHLRVGRVPVDQARLLVPEGLGLLN